jgi:Ni,Fe-hydrogenase I large subunit
LARLLHSQHAALQALTTPALALDLLGDAAPITLPMLARQMTEPGYCAQPDWQGEVPDTGPWSRHADPLRRPARSAWDRLLARLVEVLRLATEAGASGVGGEAWLAHGALALGERTGLAWTEMARGLLVHRVQLDAAGTVQSCHVLAPTEWNFHPEGVLAQALRRLADDAPVALDAAARRLAVAFDPCVAFDVEVPDA